MSQQMFIGNFAKALRNDIPSFYIDNDSFPTLINAYQWRGRIKRKRGTTFLGRLQRDFSSGAATIAFDGSGNANLITGFSLQTNASIVPGSVVITASIGPTVYDDPTEDGYLTPTGTSGPNTINYATGAILIPMQAGGTATATFTYYPNLPVMGLEDLNLQALQFSGTLAFDTTYSYNIPSTTPYTPYDVSFYKNPTTASAPLLTNYDPKETPTPLTWNGLNYQQFWTTNFENALWATNGITVPFTTANIGMQFKPITTVDNITTGPPSVARLHIAAHGLVEGDFVFVNEVVTTTGINWQTGYVTSEDPQNAGFVDVTFPRAVIKTNGTGGIAQYLTNTAVPGKDCIRWYDGDPTTGTSPNGWVNFMPPLSQSNFSFSDLPAAIYYLVGARMVIPFKDRLLFLGPVVQTSVSGAAPIYLQDTVVYSQNGTPYYTCSYQNADIVTNIDTPLTPENIIPVLFPANQTATPSAYFEDSTGFGGSIQAGFSQPITSVNPNEDVLLIGFTNRKTRLIYTGNDLVPFNFFVVNSEYGTSNPFGTITLDRGCLAMGPRGITVDSQVSSERIDLEIPDQIFNLALSNNGAQRITSQRDFINEWIYFTYQADISPGTIYFYPTQTLQYNYRDKSWAIFNESYTTYGSFTKQTGDTWQTVGYNTWEEWTDPWNYGTSAIEQPLVIAGNQQGFIVFRGYGTNEATSLYIESFSGNTVTCPDHCLNNNDFIIISGCLGTIGSSVNGIVWQVQVSTEDTFVISNINGDVVSGSYSGNGLITRLYRPQIQTKQFPVAWQMSRKTRLGPQMYLLTNTNTVNTQIELQIFLSMNASSPYNSDGVIPANSPNNTLVYSNVLYTCPESTNLGLTPANINLQMVTGANQTVIWHRMNTSLLGDVVQIGFTISDVQMQQLDTQNNPVNAISEIELQGIVLNVSPSQMLA